MTSLINIEMPKREALKLTVATFNINTDHRVDIMSSDTEDARAKKTALAAFSWESRAADVIAAIKRANVDVVLLQEGRAKAVASIMADPEMARDFHMMCGQTNDSELPFTLITLIRRGVLLPTGFEIKWIDDSDEPRDTWSSMSKPPSNGFGRIITITHCSLPALPVPDKVPIAETARATSARLFSIVNFHSGIPLPQRMHEAAVVARVLVRLRAMSPDRVVICAGDFNSFPDGQGEEQIALILRESGMFAAIPYGAQIPARFLMHTSADIAVAGTIVPYKYDSFIDKKTGERRPAEGGMGGRLDHIFYYPQTAAATPDYCIGDTRMQASRDVTDPRVLFGYDSKAQAPVLASDHLMLVATLEFAPLA